MSGRIEGFAAGSGESGITRLAIDPGTLTAPMTGTGNNDTLRGGNGNDLIWGGAGADRLEGGSGNDILVDGGGSDQLWGGGARDIFVLTQDGQTDTIRDFQPGMDVIDMSEYGFLYTLDQLDMVSTATGGRITYRGETLVIESSNGGSLSLGQLADAVSFGVQHMMPIHTSDDSLLEGTGGADTPAGGDADAPVLGIGRN